MDRSHLPYRFGVGLVLFNQEGLVFTARRNDTPDAWQFPQGGIDKEETPLAALFREMEEETGVTQALVLQETPDWLSYDLPEELLGKVWGGRHRGQRQKWFALLHQGQDSAININTQNPEFDAWRWMELEEIVSQIVPFKRDLYQEIVKTFRPIAHYLKEAGEPPCF